MKLKIQQTTSLIHIRAMHENHFAEVTFQFGVVANQTVAHANLFALHFAAREQPHALFSAAVILRFHCVYLFRAGDAPTNRSILYGLNQIE
jgi:hypothetical protein